MSQTNALENTEDLENVPLVRMEDVQPREVYFSPEYVDENLGTCVVDAVHYVVNDDDDSNIGSMISIQSEEVICAEDDSDGEIIVPELIQPAKETQSETETKVNETKKVSSDSWPTLEILPGGVIKYGDKPNQLLDATQDVRKANTDTSEMMYACAKCSQSFKYLFCLVKHVKWHEFEQKVQNGKELTKIKLVNNKYECLHTGKKKVSKALKMKPKKTLKAPKKS